MNYKARWAQPGAPSTASVSFAARSDEEAKRKADRIAVELGRTNTPRTIYSGARCVEVLQTGRRET